MTSARRMVRGCLAVLAAVAMALAGGTVATAATQASFTPKIAGNAAIGVKLTVTGLPTGTTLSFQWKRNGSTIPGATSSYHTVATGDFGKKLTVTVTSKRSGYTTLTRTSAPTAAVVKQFAAQTPTIVGTAKVGGKLTAKTSAWSPTPTFSYQWYRNGVAIAGATRSYHNVNSGDFGKKLTVKLTGRKTGYFTTTRTSAATAAVVAARSSGTGFPSAAKLDYQLGGAYTPPAGVEIVTRDNSDSPAAGLYNICYINGFQTQPGASWSSTLVLHNSSGRAVGDPDWPGEYLLDTSSSTKRAGILAVLEKVVATCSAKGFDAVEFDNLDSYSRSGGLLTASENIAMATLLVNSAHAYGLLAGQKNTVDLSQRLHDEAGFDFAVAEECLEYSECGGYIDVYGAKAIEIEYSDNSLSLTQVCASSQRMASVVYRDRDLVPKGSSGYVYGSCS